MSGFDATLQILLVALALDAVIGDPRWLWQRVPHPVVVMGKAISVFDRALNREEWPDEVRRYAGVAAVLILVGASVLLVGVSFVFINLFVDIFYSVLDPRVRFK